MRSPTEFENPETLSEVASETASRQPRPRWREEARGAAREAPAASMEQIEARLAREELQLAREEARAAREAARLQRCPPAHWGLTAVTVLLAMFSIPLIYSASSDTALTHYQNANYFLWRQLVFVAIGLAVMFSVSRLPPRKLPRLTQWLYVAAIIGLALTKWSPLGVADQEGIQRWLKLGPLTFQVSELAKIALIGMVAHYWSQLTTRERRSLAPWLVGWGLALPPMLLVFLQPHLSAAMLLFLLPAVVAFFAGAPWQRMAQIGGAMLIVAGIIVSLCIGGHCPGLKPYQQERIRAFVVRLLFHAQQDEKQKKDYNDYKDANYQAEQGMNALRRGGLFGAGPGRSLYKHGHVPEPHTDFILAIIGEEWGLFGTLLLLGAFGALIYFCFQVGHAAATSFEALFCTGVGALLAIQVVANSGVVMGVLPVTGVVLPLLSYGGSGLIVMLFAIGAVLGISRHQCDF